ncbi:MAG: hypothetical protein N5P05_004319 (plasmid) [Chroococcopsis gigantea SAG 12.99]|nr:hypothetical protein [Chroococcopsis gigantea SAG 12.99]MDV3001175.1 hypothetical protein [Chroococcopsis gigantea SAG 12.99]MDV3002664.1 hypothetical protein [Chroococcopsis gigantea SAG 12.99]
MKMNCHLNSVIPLKGEIRLNNALAKRQENRSRNSLSPETKGLRFSGEQTDP